MSLNPELRTWRQRYESAVYHEDSTFDDIELANVLDKHFRTFMLLMDGEGWPLPNDDDIEDVVTQLFKLGVEKHAE